MAIQPLADQDILSLLELTEEAGSLSLDVYLERTLLLCTEWFQASGATLFLKRDGDSEPEFELIARAGSEAKAPLGLSIREGNGIAGTAIARGEPMLVRDPLDHVLLAGQAKRRPDIGSSLVVPLQTRQMGAIGVLCLSRRSGELDFSRKDLSAARAMAGQIALAVSSARLFRQALSAEKELGEAKRLAEVGQMTAAIAHEIRNPLTGIRAAAQLVFENGGDSAAFGQIIVEETDKLDRLCGEFLEFARPLTLDMRPVDLGAIAKRVASLESAAFSKKGVGLDEDIEPELPTIKADGLRIEQVCRNLLRNALEASEPGQRVRIAVKGTRIEVGDEGSGMSPAEVGSLFVPFFTTKANGTGLGMSVVKKIVDAHGGSIEVESHSSAGTRVMIEFSAGGER